jgi:hypothetical protein
MIVFENARIRALIKKGLDQVPYYLWPEDLWKITPRQKAELVEMVCSATKDFWQWDTLKGASISQKAIFSLDSYAAYLKGKKLGGYLGFTKAAETIASTNDELLFHAEVAIMFEKKPP